MNATTITYNKKSILPQAVEWINVISTLYLIASLILKFDLQRPAIIAFAASAVIDIIVNRRYANTQWDKSKWVFVVMIAFYLCMWIWHIFEECSSTKYFHDTDIRMPFLIFGILGLVSTINPKLKLSHIAYTMLTASLITTFVLTYNIMHYNPTSIDAFRHLIPIIRIDTLGTNHIEFNLYINCTIAMCFVNILENRNKWNWILSSIGIVILYISILLNEGRIGFLIVNILMLAMVTFTIWHYKPRLIIPAIGIFLIALFAISKNHDRLDIENIKNDPRMVIWNISYDLIKEKPILGYGVCNGREKFVDRCTSDERMTFFWTNWMKDHPNYKKHRFHCHNALVESTLEFGITGLALCSLIFLLPILLTTGKRRWYLALFILIFGIQAMFESFTFHSQIILFGWLIMFFINNTHLKCQNQI